MKAFFSILVALFTAFFGMTAKNNVATAPGDDGAFVPVLRFTVASDTHLTLSAPERSYRMQKAVSMGYQVAQNSKSYKKLDACLFAGDLTDKGYYTQYALFKATVNSVLQEGTKLLGIVAKNHDSGHYKKQSVKTLSYVTGMPSDFHTVINGYHFIGISTTSAEGERYAQEQRTWLQAELEKANRDDPAKPIFLMHHEHIKGTVYGSREGEGWGTDYFTDIIMQYPQIVDFSGHSHYPLNDPRSVWQGDITAVGTGSLHYAEFTVEDQRTVHPEGYDEDAQCWVVEVNAQNEVRLQGFDLLTDTLLCEYIVKNPADKNNRQYTPAQMQAKATAPVFEKGFISTDKTDGNRVRLVFNSAKSTDGYPVFLYRFVVTDKQGGIVKSEWILERSWTAEPYGTISKTIEVTSGQTVRVYAENAYAMQSEPLVYTVQ